MPSASSTARVRECVEGGWIPLRHKDGPRVRRTVGLMRFRVDEGRDPGEGGSTAAGEMSMSRAHARRGERVSWVSSNVSSSSGESYARRSRICSGDGEREAGGASVGEEGAKPSTGMFHRDGRPREWRSGASLSASTRSMRVGGSEGGGGAGASTVQGGGSEGAGAAGAGGGGAMTGSPSCQVGSGCGGRKPATGML